MTDVTAIKAQRQVRRGKKLGSAGALAAGCATGIGIQTASDLLRKESIKTDDSFNGAQKKFLQEMSYTALEKTGLDKKGVRIRNFCELPQAEYGLKDTSKAYQAIYKKISPLYETAKGKDSYFTAYQLGEFGKQYISSNEILVNMQKLPSRVFNELGHAINANKSDIWKGIQGFKASSVALAAGLAIFGAMSQKAESKKDNGELSKIQKITDFTRNNIGKLSALILLPNAIEEIVATARSAKFAKNFLSPEYSKNIIKSSRLAMLSGLSTSAGLILAGITAVKIKDEIVKNSGSKAEMTMAKRAHQG